MTDVIIWYSQDILIVVIVICGVSVLDIVVRKVIKKTKYKFNERSFR